MKTIISLFATAILLASVCIGQESEAIADSLLKTGDLKAAIVEYEKIYETDSTNADIFYNYACALALSRYRNQAFKILFKSLEGDTSVRKLNDPDFYFLLNDDRWAEVENIQVPKVEAKYKTYNKLALAKELWRMKIKDQAFYYHLNIAERAGGAESTLTGALWELKTMINDKNVKRIEEIIEEHGWPKRSDVGGSAASAVFLIVQHADIDIQKKYLPIMTEAANNEEASWSSLALLIDRTNLRQGDPQIYGSQIYSIDDGSFYVKDLEEPEYVNQRRKEVGLGPIEDYVKRWGIEWDVPQKEK